ncbi:MAG TPA: cysteine--tRNA ligase [Spirochaetales bacterium]|nr:cysteine--tRNA ligase [Spirochaetales bacterium]HRV28513.1 cysteine--tRNA ligase [Spirochaetia bacterium]
MGLRIFNTMGRELQDFEPLQGKKVGMYGCGPTVYTYAHIGNLRAYVFQDTLVRTLRWLGYDVTHVMNITDVGHLSGDDDTGEDKMVKSAQERGKSVLEIAEFYTKAFFTDTERLNINRPTVICKATEHIADMIQLIERIEKNGYTYFAGGNLYFDVTKFPAYGKLARIKLEDLQAGARVDIDENKRNPHDFVLWFTKSKFENQALVWDSPWGTGYPGWHIECSAMSMKYLGEQFEIHTGGIDHIPVHHTNEIAQSESATGKQWVKYWMHNEFLILDKEKMSKSSGKFLTLQTLIDAGYDPLDYRYFLLSGHYRSQLQFNYDALNTSKASRKSLMEKIWNLREKAEPKALAVSSPGVAGHLNAFRSAMEDDLNTPRALAEVYMVLKDTSLSPEEMLSLIAEFDTVLGLRLLEEQKKADVLPADIVAKVEKLIQERTDAKKNKDWARADAIRAELLAMNIILEDTKDGTKWKLQ